MHKNSTTRRGRSQTPKRCRLLSPPSIAGRTLTDTLISPLAPTLDGEIPNQKAGLKKNLGTNGRERAQVPETEGSKSTRSRGKSQIPQKRRKIFCVGRAVAPAPRGIVRLADARQKYRASLRVPGKAEKDTGAVVLRRTLPETESFERTVLLARPSRRGRSQLLSGSTRAPNVRGIVREVREELAIAATPRPSDPVKADLGGGRSLRAEPGWDKHHARGRRAPATSGMAPSRVRR